MSDRDVREWEAKQCTDCKWSLSCHSGALLRSHDVVFCVNCDEIMIIKHYIPILTVQARWAGELREKFVDQFMCMPRVGGVVRKQLKPHSYVKENKPSAIDDPGPSNERMWLFVCVRCADLGFPRYTRAERVDMIRRHHRIKAQAIPQGFAKWEDEDPPLKTPIAEGKKT